MLRLSGAAQRQRSCQPADPNDPQLLQPGSVGKAQRRMADDRLEDAASSRCLLPISAEREPPGSVVNFQQGPAERICSLRTAAFLNEIERRSLPINCSADIPVAL